VVELLLRAGAGANVCDSEGYTPLHEAALYGHAHVVAVLLEHKAEVPNHLPSRGPESFGTSALSSALCPPEVPNHI
jgi:ankyrin repeat protein